MVTSSSDALATRQGRSEAFIAARAGELLSCEIREVGVPTLCEQWRATASMSLLRVIDGSHAVGEPVHLYV